jgi:hypothetical protein
MGGSTWSSDAYSHLKSSYKSKSTDDIFVNNKNNSASDDMLPKGVKFRECRDSDAHPETLGVCVFLDVTGSMGRIPEAMVREKLGTLMDTLIKHDIKDAQVLFGAIGDHHTDSAPLQVGQFESGTDELNKWLTSTWLEGKGGGQYMESYLLAWHFAARHTSLDCFEKRNQKGILFTIGDEASWDKVDAGTLKNLMGYGEAQEISDKQILQEACRAYHVYHIHVNEGSYKDDPKIINYWKGILGERLIVLEDYNQIAELIASTVAIIHGIDLDKFTSSFDSKTASDVKNALMHINKSVTKKDEGVINL